MRIAITGSTGMIGSKLVTFFLAEGHHVSQITRQSAIENEETPFIYWNPSKGQIDPAQLEGFDVIIHLAGANVGERWGEAYKQNILDSRVQGTRLLCQTIAKLRQKPKLLLSASAIGYYGNHAPDTVLNEQSKLGEGFLPDVCRRWEEETAPAKNAGVRVVNMRIGVVLSKNGGALAKMWMPFQLGLGGVLGSGRQMMSWIALDEIPLIVAHLIAHEEIAGPVNLVSPQVVSNAQFTKVLGGVIKRPTVFPVPAVGVRLLFGEMGQALLLEGANVEPAVLEQSGYQFKYQDLESALKAVVK